MPHQYSTQLSKLIGKKEKNVHSSAYAKTLFSTWSVYDCNMTQKKRILLWYILCNGEIDFVVAFLIEENRSVIHLTHHNYGQSLEIFIIMLLIVAHYAHYLPFEWIFFFVWVTANNSESNRFWKIATNKAKFAAHKRLTAKKK